jgi:hypothetical protein
VKPGKGTAAKAASTPRTAAKRAPAKAGASSTKGGKKASLSRRVATVKVAKKVAKVKPVKRKKSKAQLAKARLVQLAAANAARAAKAAAAAAAVQYAIKPLDPQRKCGAGTSVQFLYRVDERSVDNRSTTHLVFFDKHGWYCEHGRTCPAVGQARKYNGQIARAS